MALDTDGLLDQLLFKIALAGEHGLDAHGLSDAINAFYAQLPAAQDENDETDDADGEILFSLRPPGSNSNASPQASDPQRFEKLWTWLVEHSDIEVRAANVKTEGDVAPSNIITTGDTNPLTQTLAAHANERLCANENRIWHSLTEHGVDYKRIPKLEFQCLSVIAAAGPAGLLQPDVTRITGQDKRSVPKRTDALTQKGLITKELCVGLGMKTSLLRFKKFVQQGTNPTHFEVSEGGVQRNQDGSNRMIRYEEWFHEIIGHLKKNNNTMAVEDLRIEMGIHGKKWETRSLHRCMRRLFKTGLLRRLKAQAGEQPVEEMELQPDSDAESEADAEADAEGEDALDLTDADHIRTPKIVRLRPQAKVRWVRCINLTREPTEKDRAAFTSTVVADSDMKREKDIIPIAPELTIGEADGLGSKDNTNDVESGTKQRIPPQWHPGIHHTQFVFNLVNSCGTEGISTMDLTDRAMGHLWRRPLDELLGRLTDVWRISQPPHLRHLSVIRDTAFINRASHYQFRSFEHFKKLVEAGEVTWEAIGIKSSDIESEKADLDQWGFPRVQPALMFGHDGTANMAVCKSTVIKPHHRRAYDPSKNKRLFESKHAFATANPSLRRPSSQRTSATPARQSRIDFSLGPSTRKATKVKKLFEMNPKRVEAELKAWKARSKRLADHLASVEVNLPDVGSVQEHESPHAKSVKRRRKDKGTSDPAPTSASLDSQFEQVSDEVTTNKMPKVAPEERKAEIEAELLNMSQPRIYINPPGSGQAKMTITQPTGRPSKYLIAVAKSSRLRELSWFVEQQGDAPHNETTSDPKTIPPTPDRDGEATGIQETPQADDTHSYVHERQQNNITTVVEPSPEAHVKPDFVITGGRKRRSRTSLREHVGKRQARIGANGQPSFTPINQELATSAMPEAYQESSLSMGSDSDANNKTASFEHVPDFTKDRTGSETYNFISREVDTNVADVEMAEAPALQDTEKVGTASSDSTTIPAPSSHTEMLEPQTRADRNVIPYTPGKANDRPSGHHMHNGHKAIEDLTQQTRASVDQASEIVEQTPNPRGKVGVPRSGGITKHQRETTILAIIHQHGGIFGGDKELHFPFVTQWEKSHTQRPDRSTLDRVLKTLVADGRLNKIAFTFKAPNGSTVTKHIVTEPEVDPESQAVKQLRDKIVTVYPDLYLPFGIEVATDLQSRVHFETPDGTGFSRKNIQLTAKDHFLEDHTAFVKRLHPSSRPIPVKLGMTEAKLERDMTYRRRKREQEEKRQERYLRAQQEEEIEEAQNALQIDFQLETYEHEPERAKVDRGPKGRSRLSKLQRWGDLGLNAHSKALGLLGATRNQQGEKRQHGNHARRFRINDRPTGNTIGSKNLHHSFGGQHGFDSTISEAFTFTTPYQRYSATSGTFSTDPLVLTAANRSIALDADGLLGLGAEQLSLSLADLFRQANTSVPTAITSASRSRSDDGVPYERSNSVQVLGQSMNANKRPRKPLPPALERLSRPSSQAKTVQRRDVAPRASRTGIFTMTKEEEQRLIIAYVVSKTLAGGLEQIPNWGIVHQIFHYKFDPNYCRNRWSNMRGRHAAAADKLQAKFQDIFIEAYEKGELPEIDYLEPEKYDWSSLVDWAQARLDPRRFETNVDELPDLSLDRTLLDERYEINIPDDVFGINKEEYFAPHCPLHRRDELVMEATDSIALSSNSAFEGEDEDRLMLAKSWVRANVFTPEAAFDSTTAHEKLNSLGQDVLPRALEELLGARILRVENRGRTVPGRNYDISDTVLAAFKRTWDANHLRQAARYKIDVLDATFASRNKTNPGPKVSLPNQPPDHAILTITNLVARGMLTVIPELPPINNSFDAPWPRLTKWGFTDGNYKTVQLDRERMHFEMSLRPTPSYVFGNPTLDVPPPLELQVKHELGARLPLWTDISGKLIKSVWDMVSMATLHLIAFRPGCTAQVLAASYKGKMWRWEIDLWLDWAEQAGVVRRIVGGGDAAAAVNGTGLASHGDAKDKEEAEKKIREHVGWTTTDFWWMCFADGVTDDHGAGRVNDE
ncbi:hypothetical protein AAFC00_003275 [Neodothiora populina]|uniref:Myb-like domain-containing protein n=1 Tax=Neodothiora populina TaxID=2781224 RepID=A0ABR3P9W6_9PEZI